MTPEEFEQYVDLMMDAWLLFNGGMRAEGNKRMALIPPQHRWVVKVEARIRWDAKEKK